MTFGQKLNGVHSSPKERKLQKSCVSFGEECRESHDYYQVKITLTRAKTTFSYSVCTNTPFSQTNVTTLPPLGPWSPEKPGWVHRSVEKVTHPIHFARKSYIFSLPSN